jgi:hypothetical protein
MKIAALGAGLLVLSMVAGCKTTAMPSFFQPRQPTDVQQKKALRYDPYPETNVGPEMTGTRPRDYQIPPAEAARARWERENQAQYPNSERWNGSNK